jgi:hypothetical protein
METLMRQAAMAQLKKDPNGSRRFWLLMGTV